jgi:hypothetical protein
MVLLGILKIIKNRNGNILEKNAHFIAFGSAIPDRLLLRIAYFRFTDQ